MSVDWGAIEQKLNSYVQSGKFTSDHPEAIEKGMEIATRAGEAGVNCIEQAISSSGLNGAAIAAVGDVSGESPSYTGRTANMLDFEVGISIAENSRPSLYPAGYPEGAYDMAGLLDKGFSTSGQAFGFWHGNFTYGLTYRPGAHFVSSGIDAFNSMYGSMFNAEARKTSDRFF